MGDSSRSTTQAGTEESKLISPSIDALIHPFSSMTSTYHQINDMIRGQGTFQNEISAIRHGFPNNLVMISSDPVYQSMPVALDSGSSGLSLLTTTFDDICRDEDEEDIKHVFLAALPRHSASLQPNQPLFGNEFFEIRESPLGGLGAFAIQDLDPGNLILAERAVIRSTDVGKDLIRNFEGLSVDDKGLVLDLAMYKPRYVNGDDSLYARLKAIFTTNYFACTAQSPGHGLFLVASRFNHACRPNMNVNYSFDRELDAIVFTVAGAAVKAGTELTINYGKDVASLNMVYGFECACGGECKTFRQMQAAREWGLSSW
ncbi:hypothetical protein ACHAQH_006323 [Verticillium albo-atrum]